MGGPSTNNVDVGFPFVDSSGLGMTYAGFSKLKQELPASLVTAAGHSSSRPPWTIPPLAPGCTAAQATSTAAFPELAAASSQHGQFVTKQDHVSSLLHASGGGSSAPGRFHDLHGSSSPFSTLPYDLYKSGALASSSSGYGVGLSYKDRGRHHYPLQYNGGSLVLDHNRSELINLSKMTPQEIIDAKALAASKSHSEAERRRRERINNHLNTLRGLLPSTTKTDKASLLAEVIEHVKDLKRQAAEIAEGGPVPTDVDELKVDTDASSSDGNFVLKASLCCEDRPDLLSDLTKALRTLKLRTLKAEIATLGGRVKNVILIGKDHSDEQGGAAMESSSDGTGDRPSVSCVQEALRAVIERSSELSTSAYGSSKRQKMGSSSSSY
ncbi:transcription factor bHLH30 [Selaginella moellendorffii]|uniref:transcription factor bHLH30 n=1 Tax=Selaginella moellendorffii TaxID=88036 RepID=UPI000D1CC9A2|nr:transcription factor bHLH30 [Selaginella moellendorffii]|eukprot:XP_002978655.2 transcription factor bHLH30 [Selaginella moellendorffii]